MSTQTSAAPPLRQRRRERTRADLVDAVLAVIAEAGVNEVTIDRVGQLSNISRGTIYAHFPGGRDELFRAAYAKLGTDLVARTRAAITAAADTADGWLGQLDALARAMFALAADAHLGHFYNVTGPALITTGTERGIGSGASVEMIRELLDTAREASEIDVRIDPAATAVLLVGALRDAATAVAAGDLDPDHAVRAFSRLASGLQR